jgi:DNA-binding transcriptional ArsR family regulator
MKRNAAIRMFQVLGDPHRFSVVQQLMRGPRSVQQIADKLPISRPAVSRHLRVLKANRLVIHEARGAQRIYRLRPEGIEELRNYLEDLWDDAQRRFVIAAENTQRDDRA